MEESMKRKRREAKRKRNRWKDLKSSLKCVKDGNYGLAVIHYVGVLYQKGEINEYFINIMQIQS